VDSIYEREAVMKIIAIIQARMTSERLPGKVLMPLHGVPQILQICRRVKMASSIDEVIVATSCEEADDKLADLCSENGIHIFRGSLNNVLERYYKCATEEGAEVVIRLTGDNACVDPGIIDAAVDYFNSHRLDYLSYCKQLALGTAVEVFSYEALKQTYENAADPECLEHVTLYMYRSGDMFRWEKHDDPDMPDNSHIRLTVDTPEDYRVVAAIYDHFGDKDFSYPDIIKYLGENSDITEINAGIRQKKQRYGSESPA
jgi:spore coat polysaccharide biosynthesis protein SpsF